MKKTHETGAIMVEILAVLALIGVMGPMLYRQVVMRNQEISNVNIASEMRAIKEAMSAAIAADNAILATKCANGVGAYWNCNIGFAGTVKDFLPVGMVDNDWDILDDYTVDLYGYNVLDAGGHERTYVFGVVASQEAALPATWGLKRAARVAGLIGADGGISNGTELVGTNGTWKLPITYPENMVVATTILDTFEPDIGVTDPYAVSVPEDIAFKRLHAWNYFSVGQGGVNDNNRCFELLSRSLNEAESDTGAAGSGVSVNSDFVYPVGATNKALGICDPLFWVGAGADNGSFSDSTKGHVFVKNNLYLGRDNAAGIHAVSIETDSTQEGDNITRNKERKIVVYDIDGNKKLTIDATGRIVSGDTVEIHNDDGTKTAFNYGVDPSQTSVLRDVRLTSRGGARLSDILPNYITKGMQVITSPFKADYSYFETAVEKPTCPTGYAAAIMVTPVKWNNARVDSIDIPEVSMGGDLYVIAGTIPITAKVEGRIPEQRVLNQKIHASRQHLAVTIDGRHYEEDTTNALKNTSTGNWMVRMGYKSYDGADWEVNGLQANELSAIVQTYCVFDPEFSEYAADAKNRAEDRLKSE
ncbi:MAG: hypothetical protein ACI4QM_05460 [Alphaproteobacteria bacterium]